MNHRIRIYLGCAVILLGGGGSAAAAEPALPSTSAVGSTAATSTVTGTTLPGEPDTSPFSSGQEVRAEALAQLRGGTDLVTNDQKLSGTVGANVADNVVTGSNAITAGAFANMAGIPIVIQNSGANVLIQNATIINLQMQ